MAQMSELPQKAVQPTVEPGCPEAIAALADLRQELAPLIKLGEIFQHMVEHPEDLPLPARMMIGALDVDGR